LRRAVELGVNLIDTADSYGPEVSEELIAEALYPYPEDLLIATKGGLLRTGPARWPADGRPEHLREACEGSLRRLRLEAIDLYQHHRPDPKVPYEESIGALKQLQDAGKIRHIGVSNVSVEQLETAREIVEIVSVQNRFNLTDRRSQACSSAARSSGSPSSPGPRSRPVSWPNQAVRSTGSPRSTLPPRVRSPSPG
jgi:pyridoxine 4-dehydrogenase